MSEILSAILSLVAVANISCKTQFGPCDAEDYQHIESFKGKNLITLSNDKVRERLLQNFKNQEVYVHKILPKTLSVVIEKRRGFVGIKKEGLDGLFIASKDGTVLSFEKTTALPIILLSSDFENPVVGEKVKEEVLKSSRIVLLVSQVESVKNSYLEKGKLTMELEGSKAIFPTDRDAEILTGALQLILMQSKMNDKLPGSIDLRYKNPVLKY